MNNNMMTKEVLNQIRSNAESALTELNNGKSAVEVAQKMYMDRLPNKDDEIARMMAEKMNGLVADFYKNWEAAKEDYAVWCEQFLNEQTKELTRAEACGKLNKMYCALTTIGAVRGAESEGEAEKIRAAMEQEAKRQFSEAEATEELYAQLREKVSEALLESGVAADQLNELGHILEKADDKLPLVLNFGTRNADVMTVLAMQAYLDVKNGLYEEVPADATMEHVACGVCSTACALEIASKVEEGTISESVGCRLMKILGAVAGGLLVGYVGVLAGFAVFAVLTGVFGIVAGITISALTVLSIAYTVLKPMAEGGMMLGKIVYDFGAALLRGVKNLAVRLIDWIKPAAERCKERVQEAVRRRQASPAEAVQPQMATE